MIEQFLRQFLEMVLGWLPESLQNPFIYALCGGLILLALGITGILVVRILRLQWQAPVVYWARLENTGNVPGYFWLGAVSPARDLKFEYWVEGIRQVVKHVAFPSAATGEKSEIPPALAAPESTPALHASTAQKSTMPGSRPGGVQAGMDRIDKGSKKVSGIGQAFTSILGLLGALLPSSFGQPFRDASMRMAGKVQRVRDVTDKPEQMMRVTDGLKSQAGSLQKNVGVTPSKTAGAGYTQPAALNSQTGTAQQLESPARISPAYQREIIPLTKREVRAETEMTEYIEPPVIEPEQAIRIEVRIRPLHQYRHYETAFNLLTRQFVSASLAEADYFSAEWLPPAQELTRKKTQPIIIKGASLFYRLATWLMVLVVLELNLLWLLAVVRWLVQFTMN